MKKDSGSFQRAIDATMKDYAEILRQQLERPLIFHQFLASKPPLYNRPPKPEWWELALDQAEAVGDFAKVREIMQQLAEERDEW